MTSETRSSNYMERLEVQIAGSGAGIRGRGTPYGISNGRPGYAWRIDAEGFPESVNYAGTIFEPGTFSEWLADGNARRVRFLFQHGDAGASWSGSPTGANSLPIGTVNALIEDSDGLYFDCTFADHELAQAIRQLVATGALEEVSIAFAITEYDLRPADDGQMYRHATKGELFDVSVVVWGQYGLNATVTELYDAAPRTLANFAHAEPSTESAPDIENVTSLTEHADADSVIGTTEDGVNEPEAEPEHETALLTDAQKFQLADLEHRINEISKKGN